MRTYTESAAQHVGEQIEVRGWVNSRRDHGGLIFVDVRDHTAVLQLVIHPEKVEAFKLAESLRDEFVIKATGTITQRAEELKNPNIPTGDVELVVDELVLLNRSEPLPILVNSDQ